ncbi:hypothetical protein [Hymenobacter weizhouensis]|uniref:hypothetical protein n=1 Tax=Hymenobacter sp. YIM 151500-1 TaxID=2987689 RepID=UPI0022276086|nr:hypothetical protein [Hymenobacter sp. YIM 151500-1]UYZ64267.1 hypothetical protein OIS53_05310 [Hymenobacter sp. YIM 151500-1]
MNALQELGQDVTAFKNEQAPSPRKSFFKYEFEDFTLDFLPQLKAPLNFTSAFANRQIVQLAGIDIPFIGYNDLLDDKMASARAKDLTDMEELKNKRKAKEQ